MVQPRWRSASSALSTAIRAYAAGLSGGVNGKKSTFEPTQSATLTNPASFMAAAASIRVGIVSPYGHPMAPASSMTISRRWRSHSALPLSDTGTFWISELVGNLPWWPPMTTPSTLAILLSIWNDSTRMSGSVAAVIVPWGVRLAPCIRSMGSPMPLRHLSTSERVSSTCSWKAGDALPRSCRPARKPHHALVALSSSPNPSALDMARLWLDENTESHITRAA